MSDEIKKPTREFKFRDLPDLIAEHARQRPQALAVVAGETRLNWVEFDREINRAARVLQDRGIKKGDKVAMLARPSALYVILFMATLRAGACAVPLSNMASGETLAAMIEDSDAKILAIDSAQQELIAPIRNGLNGISTDGFLAFDFEAPGWVPLSAALAGASNPPTPVAIAPEDEFNIIYSSGTTGVPKGIVHTHLLRMTTVFAFFGYGLTTETVTILATPLYSNTTLVMLLPTLAYGGAIVLMAKFDVEGYLALAAREKATHTMLVPVQYERILDHPAYPKADLKSFQLKLSTSAPLRAPVKRKILDTWPGGMVEIYGLTEGGASCTLLAHEFPDKLHTVGRPAPGAELKVIGEDGKELPPGEVGELVGRSLIMMKGYHKRPDATAAMHWFDEAGNLFFRSGDMGRIDEDGFVTLLDRKKDMIISGGFNIYAADLEAMLYRHPDVADCAVIGIPSKEWGETPLGLVVPAKDASITPAELKAWANERLGKTQRLSGIEFRESLPRSTIGKILKRELREPYLAKAES